jgi:hypothetical protein
MPLVAFGVWALAGISFAVASPALGLAIGLAFGVGRAVPICVLAPIADRPAGIRAVETMACEPGLLRRARLGDAAALLLASVALLAGEPATAAKTVEDRAADPAAAGSAIAFQSGPGRAAVMRADGQRYGLPGTDPALGGQWAATIAGDSIVLTNRSDLTRSRGSPRRTPTRSRSPRTGSPTPAQAAAGTPSSSAVSAAAAGARSSPRGARGSRIRRYVPARSSTSARRARATC